MQQSFTVSVNECTDTESFAGHHLISVYPSPFREQITVEADRPGQITIFSSEGRVLYKGETNAGKTEISTLTLPAGIFIIECRSGESVYRSRVVKSD